MEGVHNKCIMGCHGCSADCGFGSRRIIFKLLAYYQQLYFWVETKGKTLEEINTIFDTRTHQSVSTVEAAHQGNVMVNLGATDKPPHDHVIQ